jgi:site-specific recombinase XerD
MALDMTAALTISPKSSALAVPAADAERARGYANAEKAAATRRAYGADFLIFRAWCEERQLDAVPASPATAAAFLAHEASRNVKASTIGRRVAAIRYAHKLAGLATPTDDELVKATVRGIRRTLGTAKTKKAPATAERLLAMAANTGPGLKGLRDRALLLLGFAGALRRSELVALNIEDVEEVQDGMKITIRHSKTDQEGAGQSIAIPFGKIACPVGALKEWIATAGIQSGAIFRSVNRHGKVGEWLTDQSVSDIVKEHAERLRLNPKQFAGHSLRAGFLTSAASRGASIFKMMDVSRHRSVDTLRGYVRDAELFKDHAGAGLL